MYFLSSALSYTSAHSSNLCRTPVIALFYLRSFPLSSRLSLFCPLWFCSVYPPSRIRQRHIKPRQMFNLFGFYRWLSYLIPVFTKRPCVSLQWRPAHFQVATRSSAQCTCCSDSALSPTVLTFITASATPNTRRGKTVKEGWTRTVNEREKKPARGGKFIQVSVSRWWEASKVHCSATSCVARVITG